MKKGLIHNLLFIFIISTSLTLISCNNTSKKITVSENTEEEVSLEESEIIKAITTGEKLLDENKLEEAKEYFNKAISLEKENKDTYTRIKDKYISINKLDEAYNIIKIAISNNVDIENMKLILKEISSKFEVIKISNSIYQSSSYSLPKEVTINISGIPISIPVTWNNENIDTNNIGTFNYEGYNDEYGRKVIVDLAVMENVYDKQIGSIKSVYSTNGKTYIDVDLVEFYLGGEIAVKEALKDNVELSVNEKGVLYIPSGYYIRNNYSKVTTYEISNNCTFQLLYYDFEALGYNNPPPENWSITQVSEFNDFKKYIDLKTPLDVEGLSISNEKPITNRETLCWIELKNGVATSIYRQFTP